VPAEPVRRNRLPGWIVEPEQRRPTGSVEFHHSPGLNVSQQRLDGGGVRVTFHQGFSPGQQWVRVRLPPYSEGHVSSGGAEMSSYGEDRTPEEWAQSVAMQYPGPSHGFGVTQEGSSVSFRRLGAGEAEAWQPRPGFRDGWHDNMRAAREALRAQVDQRAAPLPQRLGEPPAPLGATAWRDELWSDWNKGLWLDWNNLSDDAVRRVHPELLRRLRSEDPADAVVLEMPFARILARAKEKRFTHTPFTVADLNQAIARAEGKNRLPDVEKVSSSLLRLAAAHGIDPRQVVFHGRLLSDPSPARTEPTGASRARAPLGEDGMPFISQNKPKGAKAGYDGDGRCALAAMAMVYRKFGLWSGLSDAELIERLDEEDGMNNRGTYQPSIRAMLEQTGQLEYTETLASGLSNRELEGALSRAGSLSALPEDVKARVVPYASDWIWMHLAEGHPVVAQGFSNFPWNNGGGSHWVVFGGLTEDGKVLVHDPEHPELKVDTVTLEQAAQFLGPASRLFAVGRKAQQQ
jgi:hypothetical protein